MPSDLDIYRTAGTLIAHHGDDALVEAARHEDAMMDKGDLDGAAVWRAVARAIRELQSTTRPEGKPVH